MKNNRIQHVVLLLLSIVFISPLVAVGQSKKRHKQGSDVASKYQNLFLEAGYSQKEIDAKVAKAYYDVFEGPSRVYFTVGDTMAYVSDVKNHDARTEGLSYGMMIAVQLDKKEVFDKIWRWSKKYLQHQSGPREGYFAWSINPETMKKNSEGSASDGELYYVTSLLFASNKWGNNTGINYYNEARRILDAMWKKDGTGNIYNLINTEHKQITFVPEGDAYKCRRITYLLFMKYGHYMPKMVTKHFIKNVPILLVFSYTELAIP